MNSFWPLVGLTTLIARAAPAGTDMLPWRRAVVMTDVTAVVSRQLRRAHWPIFFGMLLLVPVAAVLTVFRTRSARRFGSGPVGACRRAVSSLVLLAWFDHPMVLEGLAEFES